MEHEDHRRKSKRHPIRWKAAVVFDKADGKPTLHTETRDLSIGGAAIHSSYSELTGSLVTLLLAQPVQHIGDAPKMLRIGARVVSSVHSPAMSSFRHGLSFVQLRGDDLNVLAEILRAAESARPGGDAIPAAQRAASPGAPETPSAPERSSRLDKFKQLALAKQSEEKKPDSQQEINALVSGAVEKAYRYLTEFTEQLNIVKPAYAKDYSIAGVPKFDGLTWERSRIEFRTRETSPTTKVYEQLSLYFRLSGNKQLRVTRETPTDEKLKQMLLEAKIKFTTEEESNERGSIVRRTFVLPCEVEASLQLIGNFDTGKLLLRTRNVEQFGMLDHVLAPEAITEESLDELTGFIIGESSRIGPLLLKNA